MCDLGDFACIQELRAESQALNNLQRNIQDES